MLFLRLKSSTALIPYITVLFGIHILKSAWAAILLYHTAILFVILRSNDLILFKKLFRGWNWRVGIPLLIISSLSGLSLYLLWPLAGIGGLELSEVLQECGLYGNSWVGFVIYYCVSTPILEELFWRGYLSVPNRYPSAPDFIFAGYHIIVLLLFLKPLWIGVVFLSLIIIAWIWRLFSVRFNGLAIPFVSHLIAGISVMWFINFLLKR